MRPLADSIAFEVDDIARVIDDLKKKGVEFKLDLFDSPVCQMAVCLDSEGNAVILHELRNK